jgi:transcriptional regulator with XRE-family HTH domain
MESREGLAERVKWILASRNLTLYQVSQKTTALYGGVSPGFLPHNFYHALGRSTFSPSLHQLVALSRISNYRFYDWLSVFGFHLEEISHLQAGLPSQRTMILDSSLEDPESWVPWFRNKPGNLPVPEITPLGRLLDYGPPRRLRSLPHTKTTDFVYAKIGWEDAFAFPDLLPGSIVRANARLTKSMLPAASGKGAECLFLIEHANGFCCCRLRAVGKHHVMPVSTALPYAQVELELPTEARVIGVLDLEIRSLIKPEQPEVPKELAKHRRPLRLAPEESKLSGLLRRARLNMGLSLREASAMSRRIASALGDEQYFAAPGSLSDYEALDTSPRHVHKVITLCAVYGLHFSTFLKSIGLAVEDMGKHPIPDTLVPRKPLRGSSDTENDELTGNGFLEQLLRRSEHVPTFLCGSLPGLSGLRASSANDFFWVGGDRNPLHPLLVNGLIVVVNRHKKKPIHFRSRPLWQQPLYLLLRRDGSYLGGCCSLENGILVIHPYSPSQQRPERLENHSDAEMIGQIVTVARKL